MTESPIACRVLSCTDRAATAETAAPTMMYKAGIMGWPVNPISHVATAGAVPPMIPNVIL